MSLLLVTDGSSDSPGCTEPQEELNCVRRPAKDNLRVYVLYIQDFVFFVIWRLGVLDLVRIVMREFISFDIKKLVMLCR